MPLEKATEISIDTCKFTFTRSFPLNVKF